METLSAFLVFCQTLGAMVGALSSLWSELSYLKAMRDGHLDSAERRHLDILAHGLRYGMTLLLLASFGLVVVAYVAGSPLPPALTPSYWILIALSLVIVGATRALSHRHISFPLGSAAIFTGWWFLLYLSFGWLSLSFLSAVLMFIVATTIFYGLLHYLRLLSRPS